MAVWGAIIGAIGAAAVLADAIERWKNTTATLDGGDANTDFEKVERKAKQRAFVSVVGPLLVLVGGVLVLLGL